MKAPEVYREQSLDLGRYMVAGIVALALSLAGVMGGYRLLGAAFGTADPEEGLTASSLSAPGCPPALEAADACDYDGGPAAGRAAGACIHDRGRDATDVPTRETID
jgi:hypothetical protein